MKVFSLIHDSFYIKKEQYNFIERFYLTLIRDERDLPFVKLTVTILLTLIPLGIFLYIPGMPAWIWWPVATVYFFLNKGKYFHNKMRSKYFCLLIQKK